MSTTAVETWGADISLIGAIYPFVGSEFILWIVGLAFWLGFHVWQMRHEAVELESDAKAASHPETLRKALEG